MSNLMHKVLEGLKGRIEDALTEDKIFICLNRPSKQVADSEGLIILSPLKIKVVKKLPGYALILYEIRILAEIYERASENAEAKISALISKVKDALCNAKVEITDDCLICVKSVELGAWSYEQSASPKNANTAQVIASVEIFQNLLGV